MSEWRSTIEACNQIHEFLLTKANRKGLLEMDQVALSAEFGIGHDRFHRMVGKLCADGRLKQIGKGSHGMKTVIVVPNES